MLFQFYTLKSWIIGADKSLNQFFDKILAKNLIFFQKSSCSSFFHLFDYGSTCPLGLVILQMHFECLVPSSYSIALILTLEDYEISRRNIEYRVVEVSTRLIVSGRPVQGAQNELRIGEEC